MREFVRFLHAVFSSWASGLTGGFSAPLAIAAYFWEPRVLKVIFIPFTIGCFVFAAFWVWRKEHRKVEAFTNTLPFLEVTGYSVDRRQAVPDASFLHLRITNNPRPLSGAQAEAKNVSARVVFRNSNGEPCFPRYIEGKWAGTPEPIGLPLGKMPADFLAADFTIGQTHELAIAFKYDRDLECYPFNHESYEYQLLGERFKHPKRILRNGTFSADVELIGQRVNERWTIAFENPGPGKALKQGEWKRDPSNS
jgi:hypothetical protein